MAQPLNCRDNLAPLCIMVVFGASGDLVKRKLIPALYNLTRERLLSREFAVVGFARHEMSHEEFRTKISEAIKEFFTGAIDQELWNWLVNRLYYVSGDLQEAGCLSAASKCFGRGG